MTRVSDGTSPDARTSTSPNTRSSSTGRRSRPALDHVGARTELARLVPNGEVLSAAPHWARSAGTKPFYLVIGDPLALPLAAQNGRWVTTTCLVKTKLSERRREDRAREKARRASAKRARRRARW